MNLFSRVPADQGGLTAALLALLEHSDRGLLDSLLHKAGIALEPGRPVVARFPAPAGPPGAGTLALGDVEMIVLAQATRGETIVLPTPGVPALVVTPTGRAPEGAAALSWEQVDRWLAGAASEYGPDSRTGFLIQQFRDYLDEAGIHYFAGFPEAVLVGAPAAQELVSSFFDAAAEFFEAFAPVFSTEPGGLTEIRQSRPEDLLAGHAFRDYAGPPLGPNGFLRIAFYLPEQQVQVSGWLAPDPLAPGAGSHARLRAALADDPEFLAGLRALDEDPLLWLWSPQGEHRLPLEAFRPEDLEPLEWAGYQAGIQRSLPLVAAAGEGFPPRMADLARELLDALSPILSHSVH